MVPPYQGTLLGYQANDKYPVPQLPPPQAAGRQEPLLPSVYTQYPVVAPPAVMLSSPFQTVPPFAKVPTLHRVTPSTSQGFQGAIAPSKEGKFSFHSFVKAFPCTESVSFAL